MCFSLLSINIAAEILDMNISKEVKRKVVDMPRKLSQLVDKVLSGGLI